MRYRLTVVKIEDNPAYDAEHAESVARNARNFGHPWSAEQLPSPTIETRTLDVVLTELEFDEIKRAVIKVWT